MREQRFEQNNVTLTYNSTGVVLESDTRKVSYDLMPSGTWSIYLEDKTRTQNGDYWNLRTLTKVSEKDMLEHLDKKQYQLGFFTK